jgi:nicotinamide-nucleotide amidase
MQELQQIIDYLKQHRLLLTTAESCTAGTVIALLSDVPGSGGCLESGYVVYSVEAKQRLLGVPLELIQRCNLTSEEVARAMAEGALRDSTANAAVAVTGVAGPDPMDGIPPGTVCFAWAFAGPRGLQLFSHTEHFQGDRAQVRKASAEYALQRIPYWHGVSMANAAH